MNTSRTGTPTTHTHARVQHLNREIRPPCTANSLFIHMSCSRRAGVQDHSSALPLPIRRCMFTPSSDGIRRRAGRRTLLHLHAKTRPCDSRSSAHSVRAPRAGARKTQSSPPASQRKATACPPRTYTHRHTCLKRSCPSLGSLSFALTTDTYAPPPRRALVDCSASAFLFLFFLQGCGRGTTPTVLNYTFILPCCHPLSSSSFRFVSFRVFHV